MSYFMVYGRDLLILSIVFLAGSLALNLLSPIWPLYIEDYLHASMTEVGLVFSISNAVAAVMQIPSGFLSDKYGRKRLHALGTLLAAFPPLMYALANSWIDLVPWVMLSGFASGLYIPIRWTMVADVSSPKTIAKAYSWTNISWLLGITIAPFLGGFLADHFSIRFPFFASFALILAIFPLTLFLQETQRKPATANVSHKNNNFSSYNSSGYLLAIILFSLINIVQGIGIGVTAPVIPVFVEANFPVDYTFIGILYAIGFGVASIIVQIPGQRCSDFFDRRKFMTFTFAASAPFFLLFAYSQNTMELIVFMFLSNAILNSSWLAFQTLLMEATPSSKWGLVNGISATTFWAGQMVGNALSGVLWDYWGAFAPFYASAIAIGISAIIPPFLKETRSNVQRKSNRTLTTLSISSISPCAEFSK
ncbi:MAG: MFS transporter [Candidatus Bathyarchaeia archaeon]